MPKQLDLLNDDTGNSEEDEALVISPGKIKCFVTGKLRKDNPEERVRQDVARSLVEEYGYTKEDIDIEFSIKMGSSRKAVDIVTFDTDSEHKQSNIQIIVEVKQETIKPSDAREGIEQLRSYVAACMNTKFALWIGSERLAFKATVKDQLREIEPIPDIPKKGETTIPRPTRGSLVPAVNLKQVFKRIHNYIYVNQGFQKDRAFEEVLKLLFVKVYDEQYNPTLQFYVLPGEDLTIM
jgi:type I restriction enzyme M protein